VHELLREGVERLRTAGSETARLDAEILLGDAIGVARTVLLAHPEEMVGRDAAAGYRAGIERREAGEPIAYIRGAKEFYGLTLAVDRRVLIPRPETERLVELAVAEVRRRLPLRRKGGEPPIRIVDVGTGSGAIAVALAVSLHRLGAAGDVTLSGFDIAREALEMARENAAAHGVDTAVTFELSDLLGADARADARAGAVRSGFDLVLANLPYVRRDALAGLPIAASFEPVVALDGGSDGLAVIERLLSQLPAALATGGVALLEIGWDQGDLIVERCARLLPGWRCVVETDLAGLPRVARIWRG
jgi:release factor glutamine methyltransferase